MGYDQYLNSYYNYATVLGSKITCRFNNNQAYTGVPVQCGVYAIDVANSSLAAQGYTVWTAFKEAKQPVGAIATNKWTTTVRSYFSHKKMIRSPVTDEDWKNSRAAGPPGLTYANWQWYVWVQSTDLASTSTGVVVDVTIDYLVLFSDRLPLAPS